MKREEVEDKIDVLDLLIAALKEHEKTLSTIVDRAEAIMDRIDEIEDSMKKRRRKG